MLRALISAAPLLLLTGCPEQDEPTSQQRNSSVSSNPKIPPRPPKSEKPAVRTTKASTPSLPQLSADGGPALPALDELDEVSFVVRKNGLWALTKTGDAALGERAHEVHQVRVKKGSVNIKWLDEISCVLDKEREFSQQYVQARLENTRGFRLYQKGKFHQASRAFLRAVHLDRHNDKARANLVSALARAGKLKAASQAFDYAMSIDAVHAYEKLLSDSDFEPLLKTKEQSGDAITIFSPTETSLPSYAGYSKQHNLVAVLRNEVSWGSSNWTAELFIFNGTTSAELSKHILVDWSDTLEEGGLNPARRKSVDARLRRYEKVLAALKFKRLPQSRHSTFEPIDDKRPVHEAKLPGVRPSLIAQNDTLRLVEGNRVLQTFQNQMHYGQPRRAIAVPGMNTLIFESSHDVSEGCDSGPESRFKALSTNRLTLLPEK